MGKLHKFYKHCFKIAKEISESNGFELTSGTMDIPGLDDSQGRSPFADYPILISKEKKLRMYFTYEIDRDVLYKTPWLRMTYYVKDIDKVNFYRIHRREKSILNTILKYVFITPGKEIVPPTKAKYFYYLDCLNNKDEIISAIQTAELLSKLENFLNLKMIKVDSKELVVDIKCEKKEHYTEELVLKYIETIDNLMPELLKV